MYQNKSPSQLKKTELEASLKRKQELFTYFLAVYILIYEPVRQVDFNQLECFSVDTKHIPTIYLIRFSIALKREKTSYTSMGIKVYF